MLLAFQLFTHADDDDDDDGAKQIGLNEEISVQCCLR
jgi:hypothetical protein